MSVTFTLFRCQPLTAKLSIQIYKYKYTFCLTILDLRLKIPFRSLHSTPSLTLRPFTPTSVPLQIHCTPPNPIKNTSHHSLFLCVPPPPPPPLLLVLLLPPVM